MLRSTGIKRDLRLSLTDQYSNYYYINFRSYIGQNGDCYDRYLIRMNEMSESINIINQTILKFFTIKNKSNRFINPNFLINFFNNFKEILQKKKSYSNMESLIEHFKF
jgi:NADH-quinone oxidoreductase subunit D